MVAAITRTRVLSSPSPRSILRLLAAVILVVSGLALLGLGWLAPGPPRINIRWTPQTTEESRVTNERALRLIDGVPVGERTWSYVLLDTSRDHVGEILDHPAVEDRHYIGPGRTLTPDAPPLQAWFMARYGRPPVNWVDACWWFAGPLLCVLAVLVGWPHLRAWAAATDLRLMSLLGTGAALRIWLIVHGGQYYWPDEKRYRGSHALLAGLRGDAASLADTLGEPAALMFKTVGLVPARIEELAGDNPHVPALVFGACSLVCIWLIAVIARRLGGSRDQSFFAALLATGSTALLYMARHLTSYDLALMFGLIGVCIAVRRPSTATSSMLTGIWAIATFLAYAGAWSLAAAACAIHVLDAVSLRDGIRRTMLMALGGIGVVAVMIVGYRWVGLSWLDGLRAFAGTIKQGEFSEGWWLPFAYLWQAEHLLLFGWGSALAWCLWRFREALQARLTRASLVGLICVYASLAIPSAILHRFVVYGRLSRPLVPFLCLIGGAVIATLLARWPRRRLGVTVMIVLCVAAQAAINFRVPLTQEFPAEFIARIERMYPPPRVFVNARHLFPGPDPVDIPDGYREVASAPHPLEFRPYQYEGYADGERHLLRYSDIRMRAFIPSR